jgi:hypothetical protein
MTRFNKFVLLGLTPEMSEQLRDEAKRQKTSVYDLIRTTLAKHLTDLRAAREKADRQYADAALLLKVHFDEDRTEFVTGHDIERWRQQQ